MFGLFKKKPEINTTQAVDTIEAAVYAHVRPLGFKKHGRTLHRFVSGDISQVIHFQSGLRGLRGLFCVNLGIRIPECSERTFHPQEEQKKFYHEYECTICSRLGIARGRKETWYDLSKPTDKIIAAIIHELDKYVLPVFEVLSSRAAIFAHRKNYPYFHASGSEILDESMIYGHLGDLSKAKALFDQHYQSAVDNYNKQAKKGYKKYLKKGQRAVFMGQEVTAEKTVMSSCMAQAVRILTILMNWLFALA